MREVPAGGPLPRFELPGWRDRYGVVAGITGRGPADGPAFDLGLGTTSPVGEVTRRWARLRAAEPGFPGWVVGHQVHGCGVRCHRGRDGWTIHDGVDGHATSAPGLMLAVTVADCIPVYLIDPARAAIALLHAGWRGVAGGILERGIETLSSSFGSTCDSIIMHCGIGICGACYEVGYEVLGALGLTVSGSGGKARLDLRQELGSRARAMGILHISTSQFCSSHNRDLFFSHRGSGGHDGRMVAYLGILPEGQSIAAS